MMVCHSSETEAHREGSRDSNPFVTCTVTVNLIILVEDRRSNSPQAHIGERCRQPASVGKSKLPRAEQVAQGMAKCEANV